MCVCGCVGVCMGVCVSVPVPEGQKNVTILYTVATKSW